MTTRYLSSASEITFDKIAFYIDEVHFDHKGASFGTGGLSGGNWVKSRLLITVNDNTTEKYIEERFNLLNSS